MGNTLDDFEKEKKGWNCVSPALATSNGTTRHALFLVLVIYGTVYVHPRMTRLAACLRVFQMIYVPIMYLRPIPKYLDKNAKFLLPCIPHPSVACSSTLRTTEILQ